MADIFISYSRKDSELARLDPTDPTIYFNLCIQYSTIASEERLQQTAARAVPHSGWRLKLSPEDHELRITHAFFLLWSGQREESLREVHRLASVPDLDGMTHYKLAGMYELLGEYDCMMAELRRSVECGYRDTEIFEVTLQGLMNDPKLQQYVPEWKQIITAAFDNSR